MLSYLNSSVFSMGGLYCPISYGSYSFQLKIEGLSREKDPYENYLDLLQSRLNQIPGHEDLSVNPPRPYTSYPVKKEQAEKWIHAYDCEAYQKAARAFIKAIRHVNQEEFEETLEKSVKKFNEWLSVQESQDYTLLVTPKHFKKSNRWVAELAFRYLEVLPKKILPIEINQDPPNELIQDYLNRTVHTIVFFDDAAYGCSQSKSIVCRLSHLDWIATYGPYFMKCLQNRECLKEKTLKSRTFFERVFYEISDALNRLEAPLEVEKNYKIVAIIPFMRDEACIKPSSQVSVACSPMPKRDDHVQVFSSERLVPLSELVTGEEIEGLKGINLENIPTYFDHKIADGFSSFPDILERGAPLGLFSGCQRNETGYTPFIDPIVSPYKR